MPAGQYYLEFFAEPTATSYLYDYIFSLQNNLSVDENVIADFKVYPNPTSSKIFIDSNEVFEEFKIFNILGQKVLSGSLFGTKEIDLGSLTTGTYIVKISNVEKTISTKILKQ
ncbi:T9SS type A sorting domain-containing protein [Flavobacterium sp. PLA-1-15]|uniref:T9SS type A sorting domain-containing protein n=1 Tax=Flavobacterium sp. PLA-1-15 TaxID=3380533 RepID=UPI003B78D494